MPDENGKHIGSTPPEKAKPLPDLFDQVLADGFCQVFVIYTADDDLAKKYRIMNAVVAQAQAAPNASALLCLGKHGLIREHDDQVSYPESDERFLAKKMYAMILLMAIEQKQKLERLKALDTAVNQQE